MIDSDSRELRHGSQHGRRRRRRRTGWLLVTRPWLVVFLFARFVMDWITSRETGKFLAGLPAMVAALIPLVTMMIGRHVDDAKLYDRYWALARTAMQAEDYAGAELPLQRMMSMHREEHTPKLLAAVCAEQQDQLPRARELMHQIAPLSGNGHADAHFWIAQDLVKNGNPDDSRLHRQVEQRLLAALEVNPNHERARIALTQLYASQRRYDEAVQIWRLTKKSASGYWLTLAELQSACDREDESKRAARDAIDACERRLDKTPGLAEEYFVWARAESLLDDHSEAIRVLFNGLEQCGPTALQGFSGQIAAAYVRWYDSLSKDQLDQRLELMTEAMRYGPNQPAVLMRLAQLSTEVGKGPEAFEPLYEALANGTAPAAVHLLLGTAAVESDPERALKHLNLVLEHQPNSFVTLNNLAWTLAHQPEPDLETAERLADAAWKLAPQHIEIRGTRGRIRALRGNTEGAVADLEFVIRRDPNRTSAHELLSELYEELGLPDLAAASRKKTEASQQ